MDYMEQLKSDILEFIEDNCSGEEINENRLRDRLLTEDSVTGSGSGSYFCNNQAAKDQVLEYGMEHLNDSVKAGFWSFADVGAAFINENWEDIDVMIRVFLLEDALSEVLEEME